MTDAEGARFGRRFWTLWSSFSASNLGDGLTLVGFPLLAVLATDDARLVTLVAATRALPFLVVGLPLGVIIDRFDRRWVAVVAQLLRSLALFGVAVAALNGGASITLLVIASFAVGVGEVLIDGGLPAIVRDIVDTQSLEAANGRLRAAETGTNQFLGPPLGAILFRWHPALPLLVAVGLYLISIMLLLVLSGSFRAESDPTEGGFIDQIRRGLQYVWSHPVLRPLAFAVAAFSFAGEAGNSVFVLVATERLGLSEVQYGFLLSAHSVTAVGVSFAVPGIVRRTSHGWSMRLSVACYMVYALLLGTVVIVPLIVLAVMIDGIADPTWNVISGTVRQRLVDDHIFGRMMTAYLFIAWSLQPLGAILGGVVAEAFGPHWVFVMSGCIVGSLLIWARPLFRRIDAAMA